MKKLFARTAVIAAFALLLGGSLVPSLACAYTSIRTPEDYYNAVVNKPSTTVYYGNTATPPAQNPEPAPQVPPAPAPSPAPSPSPAPPPASSPAPSTDYNYPAGQPIRTPQDYYNAVINKPSTTVYYGNTPSPAPAPEPAPAPAPAPSPAPSPSPAPAPQPPSAPAELTASEARLFELINSARLSEGRPPVEIDMRIVEVARLKAKDMVDNNYFGHTSPTYGTPGQMLRKFGISFRSVGENLAKAGDVYKAHRLILNSTEGHREILLNPNYSKVGVAVVPKGSYVVVVELFVQP